MTITTKTRRMARGPGSTTRAKVAASSPRSPSKLDRVEAQLLAPQGASIAEIMAATVRQQHSVRGAIAGALKQRGLTITSAKIDGTRRYRAATPA